MWSSSVRSIQASFFTRTRQLAPEKPWRTSDGEGWADVKRCTALPAGGSRLTQLANPPPIWWGEATLERRARRGGRREPYGAHGLAREQPGNRERHAKRRRRLGLPARAVPPLRGRTVARASALVLHIDGLIQSPRRALTRSDVGLARAPSNARQTRPS
jgi:hypothetical protein